MPLLPSVLDTYRPCLPTHAQERDLAAFTAKIENLRARLLANAEGEDRYQANTRELRHCELSLQGLRRRIEAPNADIPTFLRMARHTAGLTQYQLSQLLRHSEAVISNHERGRYSTDQPEHYRLARLIAAACVFFMDNSATLDPADLYNAHVGNIANINVVIAGVPFPAA